MPVPVASTFRVNGPARRFASARETTAYQGRIVSTRSRDALSRHPSPSAPPVYCQDTETGEPLWVAPIHLVNP